MEHVLSLGGPSPTILGSFSTRWKQANDSISSLFFDRCHQGTQERHRPQASKFSIFACQTPAHNRRYSKKRFTHPQNTDLPPVLPKNKKKPYPIPLKQILQTSRADKKLAEMGIEKPLEPPKNGLLVPELIPVAYDVLDAWKILIKGLSQLLHVVPVHACSWVNLTRKPTEITNGCDLISSLHKSTKTSYINLVICCTFIISPTGSPTVSPVASPVSSPPSRTITPSSAPTEAPLASPPAPPTSLSPGDSPGSSPSSIPSTPTGSPTTSPPSAATFNRVAAGSVAVVVFAAALVL